MATTILKKPKTFYEIFHRKPDVDKLTTHYCPGCGHGKLHKLIAEAIDELGIQDRVIFINPVGCSVFAYYYFDVGHIQVAHGRAPAVATGIKRVHPGSIVISYQGDGDLAAIGGNEIIHAANRGEHITVFFVNNAIYGMTGGQMAPTTLPGMKTTTTPYGRSIQNEGYPLRMAELIATLEAPVYVERVALTDPKNMARARRAVKKALKLQVEGKGFTFVEALSTCPTGWGMNPPEAEKWINEVMTQYFPLGVFKDISDKVESIKFERKILSPDEIKEAIGIKGGGEIEEGRYIRGNIPKKYRNPKIKIAGFGGQGILLLGLTIAQAGMLEGYFVSWLPSYGPEMRGGTANCHVNISEREIGSPLVSIPTVLMAMNRPSLEKFERTVDMGGIIMYDNSLIDIKPGRKDVEIVPVPATEIADKIGSTKIANMVMLGAYIGYTGILTKESLFDALEMVVKRRELNEMNRKAIDAGVGYVNSL
jgi:2-oxoisovalerate ferredoxin oxidoreductase beta subunit